MCVAYKLDCKPHTLKYSYQMETEKNKELFVKKFPKIVNKLSCYTSSIFFIKTLKTIVGAQESLTSVLYHLNQKSKCGKL